MSPYKTSDVWERFKEKATEMYGGSTFLRVAGREQLRKRLEYWIEHEDVPLDNETEVQDVADDFFAHHEYSFRSASNSKLSGASTRMTISSGGSLARVNAYAEALPAVLRAREEVLGTREPMSHAEAIEWLVRETQGEEDRALVEVRFRFLVPKTSPILWSVQSGLPGRELLGALDKAAVPSRIAPGSGRPLTRPTEKSLIILIDLDGERVEVDLLRGKSDKLGAMLYWAHRLSGRCVGGATSEDAPDYPAAFGAAVWLILAGIWPRVSVEAVVYPRRGLSLVSDGRHRAPQLPYMLIRAEVMDTTPDVIGNSYRALRKKAGFSRPGRPIDPKAELLCMAALDAKEIDRVEPGSAGFLETVLRRYRAKAEDHNVSPYEFPDTPAGHNKARKILARARRTFGELFSDWVSAEVEGTAKSGESIGPESPF